MRTRIFTLLLAVAAGVGTIFAWDYEHVQIGDLYYNLDAINQTAEVTYQEAYGSSYTGLTTANIPASMAYNFVTYSVTRIGERAFCRCTDLTSVTIPNSVTSIGHSAFESCSGLTSVTIPNSVTNIEVAAFWGCSGLTSIEIPNSVTTIGNQAFEYCSGLTSVTIGNSVTSIGDYAFRECSSLTSIEIPNTVTNIGNFVFYGCSGLTSVTIGNSVTSIGDYAFRECSSLTSIEIPNSVTSIGDYAFSGCNGLTSVTIGNSVTSIGDGAFSGCLSLISIDVDATNPNYCSVDGVLFNKDKTILILCPGGKQGTYIIPNTVTSIGGAFDDCTGLTSIDVDAANPNYSSVNGVLFNKDKTALIRYPIGKQGVYSIPNSVTSIEDGAFSGCSGLTSVTIPNSVTSIGEATFYGCIGLTSVTIPNSVTSIGQWAFGDCTELTSIEIPNTITSIGDGAFFHCSGLTSVTIPNSVTTIEMEAFEYCSGLTSVTIPNSVTTIGDYAFCNCNSMTSVTIGRGVTSIGNQAFTCSSLTSVTCKATTPPTCGNDCFIYFCIKSIPLYVPAQSIAAYQTAYMWKYFLSIMPMEDEDAEEVNIRYTDPSNNELDAETVNLHLPIAPEIEGFTFLKWQVVAGDLENGITIQAVYQAAEPTSAPSVYTNPSNPVQKLIRNGNVYILTGDKTYTITGQKVK